MLNPKAKVCRMHSRDELSELGEKKKEEDNTASFPRGSGTFGLMNTDGRL